MNPRIGWGQPPPGWQAPAWAPLVDPGPRSLHAARSVGRWWWPILAVGGFLAVVVQVLDHDPSASGLSYRGLLTVALAAVVVVLLTIHRRYGPRPLTRAVAEYTVVAVLATLLATIGGAVDQHRADHQASGQARAQATAADDQPRVIQAVTKVLRAGAKLVRGVIGAVRWLVELWHQADRKTAPKGEAVAASPRFPSPSDSTIWRSRS